MTMTTPYFNINKQRIVSSVLDISYEEFELWPSDKQDLALEIASELYLLRCNPFIHPEIIKNRVYSHLQDKAPELTTFYYQFLDKKISSFLGYIDDLSDFQNEVKTRLSQIMDEDNVVDSPNTLVQFSTDATGLIMEIPLLVVFPETTEQIQGIVKLASELKYSIVPRGGGSGLTGGAIPALSNAVILSLSKLKKIYEIDTENMIMHAQTGVITKHAIDAAMEQNTLFTVDPASKAASSLGGNISENAGGPYAFEYGTTLDNLLSYKMVLPQGNVVEVKRKDHPRHKIYPDDEVNFEILDENDNILDTISLLGHEIRSPNLGKDVTNKFLGGLPGIQKEGVDGIITEAKFILHPMLNHSRTLCLEFFGSTMHNAALVIEDLVHLRDKIRQGSNAVTMTSLEEFGTKYVKAINYEKKSQRYEGQPISVLLLQLDSNNKRLLENVVWTIVDITENYDNVDVLVSRNQEEANEFWEDRHKLSAISKKTSGFKLNEDVVIPLNKIPEFSDYIEYLNRYYLAHAYNSALEKTKLIPGVPEDDEFIVQEQEVCNRLLTNSPREFDPSEQELNLQAYYFFKDLSSRYAEYRQQFEEIWIALDTYRLEIANHMHAGDGNCHINIPVHSDSNEMMELAEEAVDNVFRKVLEIKGEVSGEHGIGITKIRYLSEEKITALKKYKSIQDPDNIINPEKLLRQEPIKEPYNIAWINIIQDLEKTDLPHKDTLIEQLEHIRICTRCGKCKQVCPMYYPEEGFLNHPRNKNISLGIMIAALTYTYKVAGITDQYILGKLQEITEYCT
ncbi:MAG: FAD-binding protein, partial [Thermodesulfobacteriota bacterium]